MSRLSLDDAVRILAEDGYERVGKGYQFKRNNEELSFSTGREVVKYIRDRREMFDEIREKRELADLENKLAILKKDGSSWSQKRKLEREIEEKRVYIKAKGKVLTVNRLQKVLKDSGFSVVKTETTRVKGWHEYYGDFTTSISTSNPEEIHVEVNSSVRTVEDAVERKKREMIDVVVEAGYEVVDIRDSSFTVSRILS